MREPLLSDISYKDSNKVDDWNSTDEQILELLASTGHATIRAQNCSKSTNF